MLYRTRSGLPLRSCWSFGGIPSAAGCYPDCGLPSLGGLNRVEVSGGALFNSSRAPPLASRKPGPMMEIGVPSFHLEMVWACDGSRCFCDIGIGAELRWTPKQVAKMVRGCDVQSLEWRTLSGAAQCDCHVGCRLLGADPICHLKGRHDGGMGIYSHDTARKTNEAGSKTLSHLNLHIE